MADEVAERKWLTTTEAGLILKRTPESIRNWIEKGMVRGKKMGTNGQSHWLVLESGVLSLLSLDGEKTITLRLIENELAYRRCLDADPEDIVPAEVQDALVGKLRPMKFLTYRALWGRLDAAVKAEREAGGCPPSSPNEMFQIRAERTKAMETQP